MSIVKALEDVSGFARINGVVPGIKGQRAFPTQELKGMDPFIMLDHIGPQKMRANYYFKGEAHPHRGFETITFMFEGILRHIDSLGNIVTLDSGSVQRMNAGKGIQHGGDMGVDIKSQIFHEVQLWVNLPAKDKLSVPNIHNVSGSDIPIFTTANSQIRIISGSFHGLTGPIKTTVPTLVYHVISQNGENLELGPIPKGFNSLIYVLNGNVEIEDRIVPEYHTVLLDNEGDTIRLSTSENTQLLLLAGQPLAEAVAMGGPFVMNTKEEIQQAYADFESGQFGTLKG